MYPITVLPEHRLSAIDSVSSSAVPGTPSRSRNFRVAQCDPRAVGLTNRSLTRSPTEEDCFAPFGSIICASAHQGESGMAIIVGTGDFKYRIVEDWAKPPA